MRNFNLKQETKKLSMALILMIILPANIFAQNQMNDALKLQFSDGRPDIVGVESVNAVLLAIGVHGTLIDIPREAKPILEVSQKRALTEQEQAQLIAYFPLSRKELLEQIQLAGRTPEVHRGGLLTTAEVGVSPYPKVYDMRAWDTKGQADGLRKFGKFHINSSDDGIGIDEVMTVVGGGPFTWFFVLPDNTIVQLTVKSIGLNDKAMRLSYPGLGIHAGYMDPKSGLIIAYAHGPKNFVMRYEESGIRGEHFLKKNPWVDFSGEIPTIKKDYKQIK